MFDIKHDSLKGIVYPIPTNLQEVRILESVDFTDYLIRSGAHKTMKIPYYYFIGNKIIEGLVDVPIHKETVNRDFILGFLEANVLAHNLMELTYDLIDPTPVRVYMGLRKKGNICSFQEKKALHS